MSYGFQFGVFMGFVNVELDSVSSPWAFFLLLICIVKLRNYSLVLSFYMLFRYIIISCEPVVL